MTLPGGGQQGDYNANVVLTANTAQYQQQMQTSTQSTNKFNQALGALSASLDGITKRAGKKLIQFSAADFAVLGTATATAASFEKQLGTLRATTLNTSTSFSQLKQGIENTFTNMPVARSQVVQLTTALSQLGVTGTSNITNLTNTFEKLSAATGEDATQLASGLTQLSRMMGTTASTQIGNYANSLLTVSKNAGVASTQVLDFAQAIAPMARQAGIGEAQVLGISAAFSKAGADGYVAANTFNSLVSNITNLVQTGSPQLTQYAQLIGKTAQQFARMDKTTALTDIFEAIARQGPRAIQTLNQLGIDGVRAQSAIQSVVQTGGLRDAIAQSVGSSNDQGNLNSSAKAALSGLSDELIKLRNNFTQLGTEIGTAFLTPLEKVLSVFNTMFSVMNQVVKPFTPLIAAVGALAGVLGGLGGAALIAVGLVSKLSLLSALIRPAGALRQGFRAGVNPAYTSEASAAYAAGTMGIFSRGAYAAGAGAGRIIGPVEPGPRGLIGNAALYAARAPFRIAQFGLNETSEQMIAAREGYSYVPPGTTAATVRARAQRVAAQASGDTAGAQSAGDRLTVLRGEAKARDLATRASTEGASAMRVLGNEARSTAGSFARLSANTLRTGASFVGRGVAAAGRGIWGAIGPVGAALIGIPLGLEAISSFSHKAAQSADYTDSLNPIQQYNQALGIANTNLADFSSNLKKASNNLADHQTKVTYQSATRVSPTDSTNLPKVTDARMQELFKAAPSSSDALRQLFQSYDITDPRQLQAMKLQALAAGYSPQVVGAALSGINAANVAGGGATPAYTDLTRIAFNYEGQGAFATNPSSSSKDILGSVISGVGSAYQVNRTKYGQGYAAQQQLAGIVGVFSSYLSNLPAGENATGSKITIPIKQVANAIAAITHGDSGDIEKTLTAGLIKSQRVGRFTTAVTSGLAGSDLQQLIVSAIGSTPQGRTFLSGVPTTDVNKFAGILPHLQQSTTSQYARNLQGAGPLGSFALRNQLIQSVSGTGSDINNPVTIARATLLLGSQARNVAGNLSDAAAQLNKLADATENADPHLSALARAAAQLAQSHFMQTVFPTLNRAGQTSYLASQVQQTRQEYLATGTDSAQQQYQNAQSAYQQQEEANRQYLISVYQTVKQYNTQIERSYEDYHKQVYRTERDFQIQMEHSQRDFNIQRSRMIRDFNIQEKQAALQSAQTIYNPFQRVMTEQTADAGTVLQNLHDQNDRIQKQYQQLKTLQRLGVSQQAIDVLGLADPSNAQQLNDLVQGITNNPNMIKAINAAVNQRSKATTQLTQSDFNATFRQTVDAFHRQFSDMTKDYNRSRNDAEEQERIGLNDMAADFNTMVNRAAEDLNTALTEVTGKFGSLMKKTFRELGKYVAKEAPQYAQAIQQALDGLRVPNFGKPGSKSPGAGGTTGGGASGSKKDPIYTPGTVGVNPQGQVGHYDSSGNFHPTHKYINPSEAKSLPHIGNPKKAPGAGGHLHGQTSEERYAENQFAKYGWKGDQLAPLVALWNQESGWRPTARNPSGAFGIAQALGHGQPGAGAWTQTDQGRLFVNEYPSHAANSGVASAQIDWGLKYIKERYGSPGVAWGGYQSRGGWYDNGGVLPPGQTHAVNATGGPEFILTPKQMRAFHTVGLGNQATNMYKIFTDNSMTITDVTVQAQDPNQMAKALAAKARLARLSRPPASTFH